MNMIYIILASIIAIVILEIFNIKIAVNLALRKKKNECFAGVLAFFFGFIVWVYYWSLPNPGELHKLYPKLYDENDKIMI